MTESIPAHKFAETNSIHELNQPTSVFSIASGYDSPERNPATVDGRSFWLIADIPSATTTREHFYFDLVENEEEGKQIAKMRCTTRKNKEKLGSIMHAGY